MWTFAIGWQELVLLRKVTRQTNTNNIPQVLLVISYFQSNHTHGHKTSEAHLVNVNQTKQESVRLQTLNTHDNMSVCVSTDKQQTIILC